jgi:hypothetical protein
MPEELGFLRHRLFRCAKSSVRMIRIALSRLNAALRFMTYPTCLTPVPPLFRPLCGLLFYGAQMKIVWQLCAVTACLVGGVGIAIELFSVIVRIF